MEKVMIKLNKTKDFPMFSVMIVISAMCGETTQRFRTVDCHVNYIDRMDCTWVKAEGMGPGPFHLHVQKLNYGKEEYTCTFVPRMDQHSRYHCTIMVQEEFAQNDKYAISLHSPITGSWNTSSTVVSSVFVPCKNIKFDPPFNLSSSYSNNKHVIRWSTASRRKKQMRYELQYKKKAVPWEKSKYKNPSNALQYLEFEASELDKDTVYTARVRCKTAEQYDYYKSQWSEWSTNVTFQNHLASVPEDNVKLDGHYLFILLIPLVFFAGYLLVNLMCPARVQIALWRNIPNPADFFQPLYNDHNGNFQEWVRPRDGRLHVFGTEGVEAEKGTGQLYPYVALASDSLEETISHIIHMQPRSNYSNTLQMSDKPAQQWVESDYVGTAVLTSFPNQDLHEATTTLNTSYFSQNNPIVPDFSLPDTNPAVHLQEEPESLLFQECSEPQSCSFARDDSSPLRNNTFHHSLLTTEMFSLFGGGSLVKEVTGPESQITGAILRQCASHDSSRKSLEIISTEYY